MSISLSKTKLCQIVGGEALVPGGTDAKIVFQGVEFDSRAIRGGELFVALKGATTHGHHFVADVLARGAALALVEDPTVFRDSPHSDRIVVVPDTLVAFSRLAQWWRHELNTPLFAITGSVGKTTVKELAAHILLGVGPGTYSKKSYNNHVGVPYTLCTLHRDHQWAVLEMGMNHSGELRHITHVANPDHVGITTIAPAHIECFGSLAAIAAAKFEIIEGMRSGGTVILRQEDPELQAGLLKADPGKSLAVRYFGSSAQCSSRVSKLKSLGFDGISFDLTLTRDQKTETASIKMSILGTQNAYNAACAALAATLLKPSITLDLIAARLATFVAPLMRMNSHEFHDGWRLIDDSYNANPASMGAFLDLATDLRMAGQPVTLLVGDMLELGDASERYHREMGIRMAASNPTAVAAVGPLSAYYLEELRNRAPHIDLFHAKDGASGAQWLLSRSPSVIMVKGSRGIRLDQGVELINTRLATQLPAGS